MSGLRHPRRSSPAHEEQQVEITRRLAMLRQRHRRLGAELRPVIDHVEQQLPERKEQRADDGGEETEERKIVPFEDVGSYRRAFAGW
jgi:hypothetical protein